MSGDAIQMLPGVTSILSNDNIAIVVLMVMLSLSITMNYWALTGLLKFKDCIYRLSLVIALLNERLNSHDTKANKIREVIEGVTQNAGGVEGNS